VLERPSRTRTRGKSPGRCVCFPPGGVCALPREALRRCQMYARPLREIVVVAADLAQVFLDEPEGSCQRVWFASSPIHIRPFRPPYKGELL
jgi:hypothetical protein